MMEYSNVGRMLYLEIVLPRHVSICMAFGATINGRSLLLRWRRRIIVVMSSRSLPFFHFDKTARGRKGDDLALNEGHEDLRPPWV